MSNFTRVNLRRDVPDATAGSDLGDAFEARFARTALDLTAAGVTYFRFGPGHRTPFGHRHAVQEEIYVVVEGSALLAIDDQVHEIGPWDAVRVAPAAIRCLEGGPEGAVILAIGAPADGSNDGELFPGWWAGASSDRTA